MAGVGLFCQSFCNSRMVAKLISEQTGRDRITDQAILTRAAELSGIPETKIALLFIRGETAFNPFTLERKSALAHIRLALAEHFRENGPVLTGYCSAMLPLGLPNCVKAGITASRAFRLGRAKSFHRLSGTDALIQLENDDKNRDAWTRELTGTADPWHPDRYDIIVSMDQTGAEQCAARILDAMKTPGSQSGTDDYFLEARVGAEVIRRGHDVRVRVSGGKVSLGIKRQVLMRSRLEAELSSIVDSIQEGVPLEIMESDSIDKDITGRKNKEIPTRVLLVDDEREFVQTLSERLQIRGINSSVAFDGASALDQIHKSTPEVMVIDLKMPGIDGLELLRRVKKRHEDIQVIVLTGHGSDQDRDKCMASGAFAYFQKPVDIDILKDNLMTARSNSTVIH